MTRLGLSPVPWKEVTQISCHHPLEGITRASVTPFHSRKQGGPLSRLIYHQSPVKTHQECGFLCQSSTDKCQCSKVGLWIPMPNWAQNLQHSLDSWNAPSVLSLPAHLFELSHHAWDDRLLYSNLEPQGMGLELANNNVANNFSSICCFRGKDEKTESPMRLSHLPNEKDSLESDPRLIWLWHPSSEPLCITGHQRNNQLYDSEEKTDSPAHW